MRKKYIVQLTEEEREYLHKLISSGTAPARKLNRARLASCSRPTSANTPKERRSSIVRSPGCSRPPPHRTKGARTLLRGRTRGCAGTLPARSGLQALFGGAR